MQLDKDDMGLTESVAFIALRMMSDINLTPELTDCVNGSGLNFNPSSTNEMDPSVFILLIASDEVVDSFVDQV